MTWVYGRFRTSTHTIEAARGMTRDDGVKILTESTLRKYKMTYPLSIQLMRIGW